MIKYDFTLVWKIKIGYLGGRALIFNFVWLVIVLAKKIPIFIVGDKRNENQAIMIERETKI